MIFMNLFFSGTSSESGGSGGSGDSDVSVERGCHYISENILVCKYTNIFLYVYIYDLNCHIVEKSEMLKA